MNTIIPNLSIFYRTELIKKTNELAKALKKEVDNSIEFFSQHYIEKHEDLAAKYDLFFSIGYINLNKILAYVEILSVKDENQSNKFIYEDCYTNCIGVTKAVNSFHELQTSEVSAKFNRLIEYSKIIMMTHIF